MCFCFNALYWKSLLSMSNSKCSKARDASTFAVWHVVWSLDGIFYSGYIVLNCADEFLRESLLYRFLGRWNRLEDDSEDFSLSKRDSLFAAGVSGLSSLFICS